MSLQEIQLLNSQELVQLLEKNGYSDIIFAIKEKDLDGNTLLQLTEFEAHTLKLPRKLTKNLWSFITELKENPQNFLTKFEKNPPKPNKPQKDAKNRLGKLVIVKKSPPSTPVNTKKSSNLKLPAPPPLPSPQPQEKSQMTKIVKLPAPPPLQSPTPQDEYLQMDKYVMKSDEDDEEDDGYLTPSDLENIYEPEPQHVRNPLDKFIQHRKPIAPPREEIITPPLIQEDDISSSTQGKPFDFPKITQRVIINPVNTISMSVQEMEKSRTNPINFFKGWFSNKTKLSMDNRPYENVAIENPYKEAPVKPKINEQIVNRPLPPIPVSPSAPRRKLSAASAAGKDEYVVLSKASQMNAEDPQEKDHLLKSETKAGTVTPPVAISAAFHADLSQTLQRKIPGANVKIKPTGLPASTAPSDSDNNLTSDLLNDDDSVVLRRKQPYVAVKSKPTIKVPPRVQPQPKPKPVVKKDLDEEEVAYENFDSIKRAPKKISNLNAKQTPRAKLPSTASYASINSDDEENMEEDIVDYENYEQYKTLPKKPPPVAVSSNKPVAKLPAVSHDQRTNKKTSMGHNEKVNQKKQIPKTANNSRKIKNKPVVSEVAADNSQTLTKNPSALHTKLKPKKSDHLLQNHNKEFIPGEEEEEMVDYENLNPYKTRHENKPHTKTNVVEPHDEGNLVYGNIDNLAPILPNARGLNRHQYDLVNMDNPAPLPPLHEPPVQDVRKNFVEMEEVLNRLTFNPNDEQFFRNTDRKGAKQLLKNLENGAFLFRPSQGAKFFLALTFKADGKFFNIGIERTPNNRIKCECDDAEFESLEELIHYFTTQCITVNSQGRIIFTVLKRVLPSNIF